MKNLICLIRDGHMSPKIKNEIKNLKHTRKIHYDVYTEVWEFDKKEEWLEILKLTCDDQQQVVYTDIHDIDTYKIIDINSYYCGLKNLIKEANYFKDDLFEKFMEFENEYGLLPNMPVEVLAFLSKYSSYEEIIGEIVTQDDLDNIFN